MTPRKKISWIQRTKPSSSESTKSSSDIAVVYGRITPYQDEPLAEDDEKENRKREDEADLDGLAPAVPEARYEREVSLESQFVFTVILCTHI